MDMVPPPLTPVALFFGQKKSKHISIERHLKKQTDRNSGCNQPFLPLLLI
jgi:hypothetical protein